MISVIIPTFKSPDALDLCLRSAVKGQVNKNQIIVVVDGFYEINQHVLEKYVDDVEILNLESNVGTCRATNLGVFNASYEKILIVNDDNVFPNSWDETLLKAHKPETIMAPNQIEPYPSMFSQFIINDLGKDPKSFDLDRFWEVEKFSKQDKQDSSGSTFPIFLNKIDFLRIGGFAEDYPSPSGFVADWEFFLKGQLNGLQMVRTYNTNFYHFVSVTAKSPEQVELSKQYEANCHEYAAYKWGTYIKHDPISNKKYL